MAREAPTCQYSIHRPFIIWLHKNGSYWFSSSVYNCWLDCLSQSVGKELHIFLTTQCYHSYCRAEACVYPAHPPTKHFLLSYSSHCLSYHTYYEYRIQKNMFNIFIVYINLRVKVFVEILYGDVKVYISEVYIGFEFFYKKVLSQAVNFLYKLGM